MKSNPLHCPNTLVLYIKQLSSGQFSICTNRAGQFERVIAPFPHWHQPAILSVKGVIQNLLAKHPHARVMAKIPSRFNQKIYTLCEQLEIKFF